jgi:hypothetical protein
MKETVKAELEQVRMANAQQILNPVEVVEFAKSPETELHSQFEWDDSVAGQNYRVWQARRLIRLAVHVIPGSNEPVNMYVSLTENRNSGGGYDFLLNVLSNSEQKERLLTQALAELSRLEAKYAQLEELSRVFEAAQAVRATRRPARARRRSPATAPA